MPNTAVNIKMGQGLSVTQDVDDLPPSGVNMSGDVAPAGSSMSRAVTTKGDLVSNIHCVSGVSQDPMQAGKGASDCPAGGPY